jgi:hypothetical protein
MKSLIGAAFVLVILLISSGYTQQRQLIQGDSRSEKRSALVIGNSAYATAPLKNPVNDAQDMAQALRGLGFEVIYRENLSQNDMKRAIREFGAKIRGGGVGLFYYAGHGVQVKGINYLVPVDAKVESEEEVEYECIDAGFVLAQMESARNSLNIMILDACRNNPFARSFRSASRGLAVMDAPSGTLIAYATAPGSVASDGNARNGIYTQELLRYIGTSGLTVEEIFKRVRGSVQNLTQGKQTPWEASSLVRDFFFNPGNSSVTTVTNEPPKTVMPVNVPAASSVTKKEPMKVEVRAFTIELDSCKISGGDVICNFSVRNETNEDKKFRLIHSVGGLRGEVMRAIDTSGNEYMIAESILGTNRHRGGGQNEAVLVPGIPLKVTLKFENLPSEINSFTLLRILVEEVAPVRLFHADFKSVPIER